MISRYFISMALAGTLLASAAQADLTKESCTAISSLEYPDLRIEQAEFLTGDAAFIADKPYPDHCMVTGFLEDRVGTDGQNYATGFELRMPVDWNNRYFFRAVGALMDPSVPPLAPTPATIPTH